MGANPSERPKMRGGFWRRALAVLALVAGFVVGAGAVSAGAAPAHPASNSQPMTDWWW